jgi:hypothetical protein
MSSPTTTIIERDLLVAQYTALRDEMAKRFEIRSQLVALTLLVAGTFLTIGVQPTVPESAILVYPILAMFLAASWAQSDLRTAQIAQFIRDHIEPCIGTPLRELGWENYRRTTYSRSRRLTFSTQGVFVSTQALAIALAVVRGWQHFVGLFAAPFMGGQVPFYSPAALADLVLLVLASAAAVATPLLLRHKRY